MIQGTNIILRPAVPDDRKAIYTWLAHSDITAEMMGPPRFPELPVPSWEAFLDDYLPHYFTDTDPGRGRCFIIEAKGRPVGQITYNEIDRSTQSVELDIWLAGSHCCCKGYGTDAIRTLCRYLEEYLGCRKSLCEMRLCTRQPSALLVCARLLRHGGNDQKCRGLKT